MKSSSGNANPRWNLVTNHGHVLAYITVHPEARLRDVAEEVGITERRAVQIVNDLEEAGYLTKTRVGRRNRYQIDSKRKVQTARLPMTVGQLLAVLLQAVDQQPFS
jgi:DNA-binding MarR family transcriptional regulator